MDGAVQQLFTLLKAAPKATSDELLEASSDKLTETSTGGLCVQSQVTHRLASVTEIVSQPTEEHLALLKKVLRQCLVEDLVRVERTVGKDAIACSLLLPKKYGWIGAYWAATQFDPAREEPELVTVCLPEWPEQKILILSDLGISVVLGSDYVGETKMSFLRLAMYWTRKTGGLGLHAGSKSITVKERSVGCLFFGLSGTGKTTLSTHSLYLKPPEKTVVHQDDIVLWQPDGRALGSERNFYVKTEGLAPDRQAEVYKACLTDHSLLENVALDAEGNPDFADTTRTSNGRAIVFRKDLPYIDGVDLPKVDVIFFITRRRDIVPVAAKLNEEQAAAFFMLGESVETSAGDPAQAGKTRRVVGFNPFVVGNPAEEGNRFLELLLKNKPECYLLNTGKIGEKINIPADLSAKLVEQIARGGVTWTDDADWGYAIPEKIGGLDATALNPKSYYDEATYAERTRALKEERKNWLAKFEGLDSRIAGALDVSRTFV